ncbi:hypothetical protein K435DRAFT_890679 [Dendrothele bispora CBS 962.96]|uniref:Uncharacterized protein n=1 Tax=Dendrothele bispora (strain CBS 962.96) TaxID=1314807 RepID=A0A4S8KPZ4_DENBC|nr:hypothetical protein K435DRAFT_890679 [Dendrothele bispora CBS 962.96]
MTYFSLQKRPNESLPFYHYRQSSHLLTTTFIIMAEYRFYPDARRRVEMRVTRWVDDTNAHSHEFRVPFGTRSDIEEDDSSLDSDVHELLDSYAVPLTCRPLSEPANLFNPSKKRTNLSLTWSKKRTNVSRRAASLQQNMLAECTGWVRAIFASPEVWKSFLRYVLYHRGVPGQVAKVIIVILDMNNLDICVRLFS